MKLINNQNYVPLQPNFFRKKYAALIIPLLVLGGYFWYQKTQSSESQVQYATQAAEKGSLTVSVSGSGSVTVDQSATVDPTITGTVANLSVNVGDQVEKGQFLFSLINDDLGVNSLRAGATYDSAMNSLQSARIDKDSALAAYEKAIQDDDDDGQSYTTRELEVLKEKVDLAREKVAQAEKNLAAESANYQNIRKDAAQRSVTAPISGTVNEINIKNGDDLSRVSGSSSNAQAPMIIGDLSTLQVEIPINEVDIVNVKIGQKASLSFDAINNFTSTGQVEKIDSLGNVSSNVVTYNVTIGFDELDPRLKPDMSVSAEIITDVVQDVLLVPLGAVKNQSGQTFVEVLNKGSVPEKIMVETGVSNSTQMEIKSGLKAGDKVVTKTSNGAKASSSTGSSSSNRSFRVPGF